MFWMLSLLKFNCPKPLFQAQTTGISIHPSDFDKLAFETISIKTVINNLYFYLFLKLKTGVLTIGADLDILDDIRMLDTS